MKALDFLNSSKSFVEIGQTSLKVLDGGAGREVELDRLENGQISPNCKNHIAEALRDVFQSNPWSSKAQPLCAIPARGVSLRRWAFPNTSKDELQRLLLLRLETELPLAPDKLAWGYCEMEARHSPTREPASQRQFLVAAIRKEVIEEYASLFKAAGLTPHFTLGALARGAVLSGTTGTYALLEIGRRESELLTFEDGAPSAVRLIAWGSERRTTQATEASARMKALASLIDPAWVGRRLYLTGEPNQIEEIAAGLMAALEGCIACEALKLPAEPGHSAATLGLKQWTEKSGALPLLVFRESAVTPELRAAVRRPAYNRWVVLALLLLLASASLRYAESFVGKLRLSNKLSEIKAYQKTLPAIDRELSFLQHLQSNQPPYIDALNTIANAAPPGTRFDSVSMNRAGEVALLGSMRTAQEAVGFRSKMIDSGFFSTVVVEEQTPTPDRQKVNFRISAKWKSAEDRQAAQVKAAEPKESNKADPGANPKPPPPITSAPREGATNLPPIAGTTK